MAGKYCSGVYAIVNMVSEKMYIGSSVHVKRRLSNHRTALRRGTHYLVHLQRAWSKYGEESFVFMVVEECEPEQCVAKEQEWLDAVCPHTPEVGYNRSPTASSCLGFRHTEETKEKMRLSKTGVPMPDWVKAKIGEALRGSTKTAQHRANIWINRQGWKHSDESKARISASLVAASAEGRRSGPPDGWTHSEEAKRKISAVHKGKPKSPEHRAKIKAAVKAAMARKRAKANDT